MVTFHFFFNHTAHHRDLHSFPTRRSSDLSSLPGLKRCPVWLWTRRVQCRSEEHTSELQSPMYIVCRLLLEKKKLMTCRCVSAWAGLFGSGWGFGCMSA